MIWVIAGAAVILLLEALLFAPEKFRFSKRKKKQRGDYMGVPQYTTPTFRLTFSDTELDLTQAAAVYVTFRAAGTKITKTGEDLTVSEHEIDVRLTQSETGLMRPGLVAIQANWITAAGDRAASGIAHVNIGDQLLKEVIP